MTSDEPMGMFRMIMSIPDGVRAVIDDTVLDARLRETANWIAARRFDLLVCTGAGTSSYVARTAAVLWRMIGGVRAHDELPLYLAHYPFWRYAGRACGMAFSHSGKSKTVVEAVYAALKSDIPVVGVTSLAGSPLATAATMPLIVPDGLEPVGPKTRSYVCALVLVTKLAVLTAHSMARTDAPVSESAQALSQMPALLSEVLRMADPVAQALAKAWVEKRKFVFLGSGPNYGTILEAALKMKEASYSLAEGCEIDQEAHGPLVALDERDVVIIVAPDGPSRDRAADLLRAMRVIGVSTWAVVTGSSPLAHLADHAFRLPVGLPETLTPLVCIVPLYLLAYYLAMVRGTNPDLVRSDVPKYAAAKAGLASKVERIG